MAGLQSVLAFLVSVAFSLFGLGSYLYPLVFPGTPTRAQNLQKKNKKKTEVAFWRLTEKDKLPTISKFKSPEGIGAKRQEDKFKTLH